MSGDARVRGGLVLGTALVTVGLVLGLFSLHEPIVGFGVIFGGWLTLVIVLVREWTLRRIPN